MMRVHAFLLSCAVGAAIVSPVAGQTFVPGTIGILPFAIPAAMSADATKASSLVLGSALKDAVQGQRFTSVLDRSGDQNIIGELERTESVWTSGSAVQVAQDGQLNANYIAYGNILSHTYDAATNCARIDFLFEIVDVSTGETVVSEDLYVDNGRGISFAKVCTETSEASALSVARGRAEEAFRDELAEDFGARFGYQLVDMRDQSGMLELLLRAADGDPKRGTDMVVLATITSSFDSTQTYTQELGRLKVDRLEGNVAIATFEDPAQAEAFVTHVNEHGPRSLQVKKRG